MVRPTAPRCSAGAASERPGFGAATSIPTREDRRGRNRARRRGRDAEAASRGRAIARRARAREPGSGALGRTTRGRPRPVHPPPPFHPPVRRRRRRWRRASRRRRARARCVSTPPRAPGGAIPRRPSSVRFVRPARRRPSTHRHRRRPPTHHQSHLISSQSESSYDSDAEEELERFDVDPFQKPLPRIDEQLFFALRDVAPDLVVGAVASVRIARRREAFDRSISRPRRPPPRYRPNRVVRFQHLIASPFN
jgi:hypothetical protein